jgi:hypothetical protein
MADAEKITKWAAFTERIGLPGALLIMVCLGLYFGAVQPIVTVASKHIETQTEVLSDIGDTIENIHVVVESDRAEKKKEAIDDVQDLLERHDYEALRSLDAQTKILDKLVTIIDDMKK